MNTLISPGDIITVDLGKQILVKVLEIKESEVEVIYEGMTLIIPEEKVIKIWNHPRK